MTRNSDLTLHPSFSRVVSALKSVLQLSRSQQEEQKGVEHSTTPDSTSQQAKARFDHSTSYKVLQQKKPSRSNKHRFQQEHSSSNPIQRWTMSHQPKERHVFPHPVVSYSSLCNCYNNQYPSQVEIAQNVTI